MGYQDGFSQLLLAVMASVPRYKTDEVAGGRLC